MTEESPPIRVAFPMNGVSTGPTAGLDVYANELLRALVQSGRIEPVLYRTTGSDAFAIEGKQFSVHALGTWSSRTLERRLARLEWVVPDWDVAHFTDVQTLKTGRPSVATVHDLVAFRLPELFPDVYRDSYLPMLAVYRRATRRAVDEADVLVCDTDATRADLLREFPAVGSRAITIRPGVRRPPLGFERRPRAASPRVLILGRVEYRKNIALALRAASRLRQKGIDLHVDIVGSVDSIEAPAVRAACAEIADASWAHWHGKVPGSHLWELMASTQLVLSPTLYEGFGFPPLEAIVAGVPVIASDIAPHRETMSELATLIDPLDEDAWTHAIDRVLEGDGSVPHHADSVLADRGVDWSQCAGKLSDVYARLVGRYR